MSTTRTRKAARADKAARLSFYAEIVRAANTAARENVYPETSDQTNKGN